MSKDGMESILKRSVISVPPLARKSDGRVDTSNNIRLFRYLRQGGVSTLLYGGNANFYNMGLYEYAEVLDLLAAMAGEGATVIPSAGPEYGRLMDQASVLKERNFPTVMVLPASAVSTPEGVMRGIRQFADRLGTAIVVYIKSETYLRPEHVATLVDDGVVSWIKYAMVREDPREDDFLRALLDQVERRYVVSGIGELPAVVHLRDFGLAGFTSGSVCLAPALSTQLLRCAQAGDWKGAFRLREFFLELEGLRNGINPITVLHEAVTLSGLADLGPILPLLANLAPQHHARVREAAIQLLQQNEKEAVLT